jgi:hypothetical protein
MQNSPHPLPKTPDMQPLPGSLHPKYVTCGKATCRCARGELHGPYWRRFWREDGSQRTHYVRLADLETTRQAVAEWRRPYSMRAVTRAVQALERELEALLRLGERLGPRWDDDDETADS